MTSLISKDDTHAPPRRDRRPQSPARRPAPALARATSRSRHGIRGRGDRLHPRVQCIEGNTLTLAETEIVIRRGLTGAGKPLKDHLVAFRLLQRLVAARTLFTESVLLQLHTLILHGIEDEWAGRYRPVPVRIAGSRHIPPNPLKVPDLMAGLFAWYRAPAAGHPVEVAADLHLLLAQVHPFIDGNGRVCRLALNLHLLQHGFPLTTIRAAREQRAAYYHALAPADESGQPAAFRAFVAERVLESLRRYEEALG
ncbi:MAG: Fic family protein [Opitutus sp.]|nr:Fic family protein [Opitutus sp.]